MPPTPPIIDSTRSDATSAVSKVQSDTVTEKSDRHPRDILNTFAEQWKVDFNSKAFAEKLDEMDPLKHFRDEFYIPKIRTLPKAEKSSKNNDDDSVYLCGHSLGLQPKRVRKAIDTWLNDWANLGVYGHVHGANPFAYCDYPCIPIMSGLVGGNANEVGVMNQLTTNLHFMMISFYRPTPTRFKILYEERAFPSDEYAIDSQIRFHGYDPSKTSIRVKPRQGETYIRTEDIVKIIEEQGSSIALVLLSGVQYYTGQLFDIPTITRVAHEQGCIVGWDLAHAVGNVPLKLHDWNVDFAVWCTYKYLNASAGAIGGIFIHSNQFNQDYPHLDGWWGNRAETRFEMRPEMDRAVGADGFRISNPSIHQCATLAASLEVFGDAGIENLRKKSKLLTQYLYDLIENEVNQSPSHFKVQILTPSDPEQRGAQISFRIIDVNAREIFELLEKSGVCLDLRGDVIRIAPIPLYNSFMDVYQFVSLLKSLRI